MAENDAFAGRRAELDSPAGGGFTVVPHATKPLPRVTRGLYVGTAGDVVGTLAEGGVALTFVGVPAGTILPIRLSHISTSSTAGSMVGLY